MKPAAAIPSTRRQPRTSERPRAIEGDPAARVLQQFRIVFNAVKAHFQQVERRAGMGGAQVWALSIVRDRQGLGVNDLAAAMSVRQPTASNLVKSLAQQGLIEVRREGPDRRAVQLHILPDGRRLLRRAPGPFAGVLPEALASLDEAALLRLESDLAQVIKALKTDDRAAGIPLAQL
jgi:DNA-binding MarR family transcriptional regulator